MICTRCQLEQPASEFYRAHGRASGFQAWCKSCVRDRKREGYVGNQVCPVCATEFRPKYGRGTHEGQCCSMTCAAVHRPRGEANGNWKGDEVGYFAAHTWMNRNHPRTGSCTWCGATRKTQWATLSGTWDRNNLDDWAELCVPCHKRYDLARLSKASFDDVSPPLVGLWTLDVYEGDIVRDDDGHVMNRQVDCLTGKNLIVTVGKQMIMDRLFGLSAVGAMTRIGVGTSATAAAVGNTTLTGGVFVAYDSTPVRSSLTVTCVATFNTATANISWNELAMDNGTTMLNRIAPIGPFAKTAAVSIIVTVTITQA